MNGEPAGLPNDRSPLQAAKLTDAERAFLDEHSGTVDRPGASAAAAARIAHLRATSDMPSVQHLDEIIDALAADGHSTEPFMVAAFVGNAIVEVPGTEDSHTVRDWLEAGRPVDLVIRLVQQMKYGQ